MLKIKKNILAICPRGVGSVIRNILIFLLVIHRFVAEVQRVLCYTRGALLDACRYVGDGGKHCRHRLTGHPSFCNPAQQQKHVLVKACALNAWCIEEPRVLKEYCVYLKARLFRAKNVQNYARKMLDFKHLHEKQATLQCCGQKDSGSRSGSENLSIFNPKCYFYALGIWSRMFIPDPDPVFIPIPDPGSATLGNRNYCEICFSTHLQLQWKMFFNTFTTAMKNAEQN